MQFLSTLFFISGAAALGINCRGSFQCFLTQGATAENIQLQIGSLIATGGGDRTYNSGDQIACSQGSQGSICAFFQNGASGTAQDAFNLVQQIVNHGCGACGSVPTQDGNDVSTGELTINFAAQACCQGNCHC